MISKNVTVKDGRFVSKAKVTDTIYKGFMLYKAGTSEFEAKSNIDGTTYNGSLDDVKRQIDKYWEKKDAEEVLKANTKPFFKIGDKVLYRNKDQAVVTNTYGSDTYSIMVDNHSFTTYGNQLRPLIKDSNDDYSTITVVVKDQDNALFECIQKIKKLADPGHSFDGVLDPDGDNPEKIGFDGDGSFFIKSITRTNGDKTEYAGIGKHNDVPDEDFNPDQLAMGIEIEKEHTDNEDIATAIAKDHLSESPDYYIKLKAIE